MSLATRLLCRPPRLQDQRASQGTGQGSRDLCGAVESREEVLLAELLRSNGGSPSNSALPSMARGRASSFTCASPEAGNASRSTAAATSISSPIVPPSSGLSPIHRTRCWHGVGRFPRGSAADAPPRLTDPAALDSPRVRMGAERLLALLQESFTDDDLISSPRVGR
jgi:hypothetical protein